MIDFTPLQMQVGLGFALVLIVAVLLWSGSEPKPRQQ